MQKIYLRQGEGADYVMGKNDPINSGGMNQSTRPFANKFAVYNLTATTLNTTVGTRGAIPTQYPSQIGAYFQWGLNTNAYAPYGGIGSLTWSNVLSSTTWSGNYETCPTGYRRPKDTDVSGSPVSGSEIRQSLFEKPKVDDGHDESNVLFGYYADGFYDRRKVERPGGNVNANGYVAGNTPEMAWGGRLFFNPVTNASLFFPVGTYRGPMDGAIPSTIAYAHYFTSSSTPITNNTPALALHSSNGNVLVTGVLKGFGVNIRCVKE